MIHSLLFTLSALALVAFVPNAQADYYHPHRFVHGPPRPFAPNIGLWHRGRWYHGDYAGRLGWWWIVGSNWHFYSNPVYPYPDPYMTPVYVVEVQAQNIPPGAMVVATTPTTTYVAPPQPTTVVIAQAPPAPPPPAPPIQAPAAPPGASSSITLMPTESSTSAITMTAPSQAAPTGAQYYFCANPQGYYPTVTSCPGGWAVTPAPAPH